MSDDVAWPTGPPVVGQRAQRSRTVTAGDIAAVVAEDLPGPGTVFLNVSWDFRAPVRPGDTITGEVEVTDVRPDKPITNLRTRVVRDDGVVAVDGTAVCYTLALPNGG
jgi:acyl dehydratase